MTAAQSTANAGLAIVERAYRGAVEKQFFDALYLAAELHRQLGGLDIVLRGAAVTYAVRAAQDPPLVLGGRTIDTLTTPRGDLAALLDIGAGVFVERDGLAAHGLGESTELLDGVTVVDPHELARHWVRYQNVFYL